MAQEVRILRVVVASPGDVQGERDTVPRILEELNQGIAADRGLRLLAVRWEKDAYPGFDAEGPQGLIDTILRLEDADVVIGIFWKRFGTPVQGAQSGTEHEFRLAYKAWEQKRRPQVMVYFNQKAYTPQTKEETDQWGQVLEFREAFPKEGLWWPYNDTPDFERLLRSHLTSFVRDKFPIVSRTERPASVESAQGEAKLPPSAPPPAVSEPPGPETLTLSPPSPLLRLIQRVKGNRVLAVTLAGAALVVIVAALAWVHWRKPQNPRVGTVRENPKDGLKYVWIPPGSFQMGCSPGDNGCDDVEEPSHQVTISKGFWIGQTEVTVGAYKRFAGATGRQMPSEANFSGRPLNPRWDDEAMPIVNVTWDEAQAYCRWAGGRLPTEAEWEYAARAGSTAARYGDLDEIAWYADNSGRERLESNRIWKEDQANYEKRLNENGNGVHEVGQKRANGFGLYDVLGNVWEWVNDWYDPNYYQNSPPRDPPGPSGGEYRVLRGGSWIVDPRLVRVSYRLRGFPGYRTYVNGFRCGWEVFAP